MLRCLKGGRNHLSTVAISGLIAELHHVIEPHMKQHDLQFTVNDYSADEFLVTDRQALCGALINLLENAVQASPAGGRICFTTRMEKSNIVFSVRDNGPGIDSMLRERLFEPFFTTRSDGTGLGLAIARSVIQSMGGNIQINSLTGTGTEFVIHLPRCNGD